MPVQRLYRHFFETIIEAIFYITRHALLTILFTSDNIVKNFKEKRNASHITFKKA